MSAPRIAWRRLAATASLALLLSTGTAGQRGASPPLPLPPPAPAQIRQVEILLDGTVLTALNAVPYTFQWDTSLVPGGVHQRTVRATDATGAIATHAVAVAVFNAAVP